MHFRNLFTGTVLDIAWSRSGLQLIACSTDGTVAYVSFGENELGKPLSSDEKVKIKPFLIKIQQFYSLIYNVK